MAQGLCELLWVQKLLAESGLLEKEKFSLFYDNNAVISFSKIHRLTKKDDIPSDDALP